MLDEKTSEEVYRVVTEGSEYRLSGYNNPTGLYSTLKGARAQRTREDRPSRRERGQKLKIQKARLVWEDVE